MSEEATLTERWDAWFRIVDDDQAKKEWEAAKSVHTDQKVLDCWATIIEFNRINRLEEKDA